MKKVLVIIAPMGFGPASKGVYLAEKLSLYSKLTLVSDGDAYDFVVQYAPSGTTCLRGGITHLFTVEQLRAFDTIISINNMPAVLLLSRAGLGKRVVFLDDLLHWRQGRSQIKLDEPIAAYLVQDFPVAVQCACPFSADEIHLVAPMHWSSGHYSTRDSSRHGVTLCLGGVTSAVVLWEDVKDVIKTLIEAAYGACERLGLPLTVIGNDYLRELDMGNENSMKILGMVNPQTSSQLIANSQLLMTTPGIGTVYEGLATSTPILLMPPNNSTQLQQYQMLSGAGLLHSLAGCAALPQLYQVGDQPWREQAALCFSWLKRQADDLPRLLNNALSSLDARDGRLNSEAIVSQQDLMFNRLSRLDINDVLRRLVG